MIAFLQAIAALSGQNKMCLDLMTLQWIYTLRNYQLLLEDDLGDKYPIVYLQFP
ncbi:hypothetical protein I4641_00815 [Waterburya agarophytonicola K14]|uniref:Uncharacterized protein n=1 Tax=Waterburya agarophytonicola KI4 TaxID=2874699 RepID=A0A964BMP5_9CYAN|nr:hypothetical protein [Waterburya agarophytonicola]MCC0175522.1 hypothetical protein [Waterburya agarophytonicola KI4]